MAKKITEEVILALPEDQFRELYLDIKSIITQFNDKYEEDFLLGEFIKKDYVMLLKQRFKALKKKYGELNYETLNKDKIVKDLKDEQNDKTSIEASLRNIGKKYNLTEYNLPLDFLPLVINARGKRYYKKNYEKDLVNVIEELYDKITFTLHFPLGETIKRQCIALFLEIYNKLKWGTKYRSPHNLSPIVIYMFFNMRGWNIDIKDITGIINISDKNMRQGLKEIIKVYPEYLKKDKKVLVLNRIQQIQVKFALPVEFVINSKAIMEKLWPFIYNTTENIIAGTVCVLTVIAMDIKKHNYPQICNNIGIAPSSVIYQIKNKLFKRLHISGFQSVEKSREMIKELILQNVSINLPK